VGLVAALLCTRLLDEAAGFVPHGTFESFRRDLDLTYAQASAVLAAAAPGAILGNGFSIAADYVSRRVLAAGGAAGYALSLFAFGMGDSFAMLVAASFGIGLASTALIDASEIALVDVAGDDLPSTLASANLVAEIGDLMGPLLIVVTTGLGFGWRTPVLLAAVAMAVYAIWLAILPLPPPQRSAHGQEHDRPARALRAVMADRRVWFYALVAVLLGPLDESLLAFLIAFAQEQRGLSPTVALVLAMGTIVGAIVVFAVRALRPIDPVGSLVPSAVAMAVTTVALVVFGSTAAMAGAAFAFGAAIAAFWAHLHPRILLLRPGQTGTVKAVISTVEFLGFGLPIAYGAVADAHGVTAGFACYAATAIALAVLCTRAPRPDRTVATSGAETTIGQNLASEPGS
jgi:predicted MFS family arabinose efflux permease